jgi:hypothetical protein
MGDGSSFLALTPLSPLLSRCQEYAHLLADLLQDVQCHERESLLYSRMMLDRFNYTPYYPGQ